MLVDLPLDELWTYRPEVEEPADFDAFWAERVAAARALGERPRFTPVPSPVAFADVYDVRFSGHGGNPIGAWLLVPHEIADDAAVVIEFIGYGGGRGDPFECLSWAATGRIALVMDNRGQGGGWRSGDTADPGANGNVGALGFVTAGIDDPASSYYTRLFVDAARAVDAVAEHERAAGRPVVTTGGSQGGALAIAAAHLNPAVVAVAPDVPFLAHPRRAVRMTAADPFGEIIAYCARYPAAVNRVFTALAYVDTVNHAKRLAVPALFSVGLLDEITPASTVFAAYNHVLTDKRMAVYEFNGHEGGGTVHLHEQIRFVQQVERSVGP